MSTNIDFTLTHNGKDWICKNSDFNIKGEDFAELDTEICNQLRQSPDFKKIREVEVSMNFDYSTIPMWLRQYMAHYFNRKVTLQL